MPVALPGGWEFLLSAIQKKLLVCDQIFDFLLYWTNTINFWSYLLHWGMNLRGFILWVSSFCPFFLSLNQVVISTHKMLLSEHGGSPGLCDEALLDSALTRPQQRFAYEPESSIFELAASYSYGLARNHSFVDGNKRIALTVAAIFLEINGFHFNAPEPEVVVFFENLASNNITENELADWFKVSSSFI